MKKRLLALLLAGAMSVGLAACGNSGDEGSANTPAGGNSNIRIVQNKLPCLVQHHAPTGRRRLDPQS